MARFGSVDDLFCLTVLLVMELVLELDQHLHLPFGLYLVRLLLFVSYQQ